MEKAATIGEFTDAELRESIDYIRSLPTGSRWRIFPRRERYGPDVLLLSWVSHAEDLLNEIDRLRRMTGHRTIEIAADDLAYWRGDSGGDVV